MGIALLNLKIFSSVYLIRGISKIGYTWIFVKSASRCSLLHQILDQRGEQLDKLELFCCNDLQTSKRKFWVGGFVMLKIYLLQNI